MAYKKRRGFQSIMEEESYKITREKLPKEWVIHTYTPDYGIDCVIEIFDFINSDELCAETLSELFFVQLKSVKNTKIIQQRVYSRMNVEKLSEKNINEYIDIDVISYPIDVSELLTVQSMSATIPVLLFLADLQSKELYFICLNDYIEKILLHEHPNFSTQDKLTIHIPITNKISDDERIICQLVFYAKRAKLFAAFGKFQYQRNELYYEQSLSLIKHFISIIKNFDFWRSKVKWPPIVGMIEEIEMIEELIAIDNKQQRNTILKKYGKNEFIDIFVDDDVIVNCLVKPTWDKLCNLGNIYEEICKEWFLPTYFWYELY